MTPDCSMEVERWYHELYKLMWAMVWDIANSDRFYLEPDEVFAELSEELVRVVLRYYGKEECEMKPLLITSLRHRCVDLQMMEYATHRDIGESEMSSLDENVEPGDIEGATLADKIGRPGVDETYFDLDGFLASLEDDPYFLVMEILEPSERFGALLGLMMLRKKAVSENGFWKIKPNKLLYRRSLGWSSERMEKAWEKVRNALCNW